MLKRLALVAALVAVTATLFALNDGSDERNSLSFGAGGGGLIGVSYDRVLWRSPSVSVNANAGVGWLIFGFGFPHGVTVNVGGTHSLELGITSTLLVVEPLSISIFGPADDGLEIAYRVSPLVGYRRQLTGGGMVFRLYFSPFIYNDSTLAENDNASEWSILPWGGLTFGFTF